MAKNDNLWKAKETKNNEFYTQLNDIENEISMHDDYVRHFKGKTILMNCDDHESSNFFKFFMLHAEQLKYKKIISTHFNKDNSPSYKLEWSGEMNENNTEKTIKTPLKGNGDFRSEECIELLRQADIVVTNPPFSLFREYIAQLIEFGKKFIIIGSDNVRTYKECFPLFKNNKVWPGYTRVKKFMQPDGSLKNFGNIEWYTNLDIDKIHEPIILLKNYKGNEEHYPKYDNYDAIEVSKVSEIPKDYYGIMGVPITFLDKYCPEQFEILGLAASTGYNANIVGIPFYGSKDARPLINGKNTYARIFIRRKKD